MRVLRCLLAVMLGVLLPACSESAVGVRLTADAAGLTGHWIAAPNDVGAVGWHQSTLTLETNGRFASTSSSYGLYEGQHRNAPSSWTRIEGTFRVDGVRLHFEPKRLVWWDQFESPASATPQETAYPWGSLFDDATFTVDGDMLRLAFNVYPADAPIPVVAMYGRAVRRD